MTPAQVQVILDDPSAVAEARHRAGSLARAVGLDETAAGQLAVAVTEAAGNIVKHATRGRLLLRGLEGAGGSGVEVLACDQGPGMASVADCMRDGHSTAGSPGTGLGALNRMTSALEIWSLPGKGTLLRFEVWRKGAAAERLRFACGAVRVPKPGENDCGDDWTVIHDSARMVLFVVDGLGHGPAAATAARAAVVAARKHAARKPAEIIEAVHDALRPTRGAAAAVAVVRADQELCTFCGIGNIAATIRTAAGARNMVSHNGILGHQVHKVQEFQYPFPRNALLLAHSDGLATRWNLGSYPGLEMRHPALIATALYRDHSRGRDDVTVVALREERPA